MIPRATLTRILPHRRADLTLWALGGLVLLSIVGFAGYYYYDRYVHADEKLLDKQAQHIEELVQKNPQNAGLRVVAATFYLEKGQTNSAIEQGQEALKIEPKLQPALVVLGRAYAKKGDLDQAVANYEQVVELNKDNQLAKVDTQLGVVYYELGQLYAQQGKYPQAVDTFKQALEIDRTDADAHTALALVYQRQNDHQSAVQELQEALRFDPFSTQRYQALATSYTALGKAPEAAYAQGMVAFTSGKYSDAAKQLEAVTAQSPDLAAAYFGLGLAYEKLGKRDQAVAALERFLAANPNELAATEALTRLKQGVKP
jgi:tetratricopeptide (TPR) repeat protein